jgi:hypothetical protein
LSPTSPVSRGRFRKNASSLVWIKKRDAKPSLSLPALVGPTSNGLPPTSPRKSGLHRFLGFHWRSKRERAPVHGVPITAMARRPPPGNTGSKDWGTGSSGPFGLQCQGGSDTFFGNFNTGNNTGSAGNGAGFPQGSLQFGSARFGFNAVPQGNQNLQNLQGGSGNLGFPQASQGEQGSFPPQEFNSGGGFVGNAPRRGG